jgi:hypothetical protein
MRKQKGLDGKPLYAAGESAIACAQLEMEAVFLLCAHAAKLHSHHALVRATLESVALRMGYPSLRYYTKYHMDNLVFLWYIT